MITEPLQKGELSNIEELMAYYGVTTNEGIVIEGNQSNYAFSTPYYLLPDIQSHTITTPLIDSGYYVLLPLAQGLSISSDLRNGLTVTSLLNTTGSAFSKIAGYGLTTYEKEEGNIDGAFSLAIAITEEVDAENTAHIVWVSSSSLLNDSVNTQVSGGNQDFFLNAIGWMCEQDESTISIHSKSLDYEYLTIDSGMASTLSILVVGLIPLAFLAIGITVWVRRKRR